MTDLRPVLISFLSMYCTLAVAESPDACKKAPRVSDTEALRIAKAEVSKRVRNFDASHYTFSVQEEACNLVVDIENKDEAKTGRHSVLILDRSGQVKRYFGGM